MKDKKNIFQIKDLQGKVVFEKELKYIPLKEETIISKSIEFYNDPEPCMIHRAAVRKRVLMEMTEYINKNCIAQDIITPEDFPYEFRRMVEYPGSSKNPLD